MVAIRRGALISLLSAVGLWFAGAPRHVFAASADESICAFSREMSADCLACVQSDPPGAWTALGCIPSSPDQFLVRILQMGTGIAGGIAFILILFGGLQVMTSSGNPEKMNAGKELIGAAITGLLMIIFSVFILKVIGVDILGIPGWTAG